MAENYLIIFRELNGNFRVLILDSSNEDMQSSTEYILADNSSNVELSNTAASQSLMQIVEYATGFKEEEFPPRRSQSSNRQIIRINTQQGRRTPQALFRVLLELLQLNSLINASLTISLFVVKTDRNSCIIDFTLSFRVPFEELVDRIDIQNCHQNRSSFISNLFVQELGNLFQRSHYRIEIYLSATNQRTLNFDQSYHLFPNYRNLNRISKPYTILSNSQAQKYRNMLIKMIGLISGNELASKYKKENIAEFVETFYQTLIKLRNLPRQHLAFSINLFFKMYEYYRRYLSIFRNNIGGLLAECAYSKTKDLAEKYKNSDKGQFDMKYFSLITKTREILLKFKLKIKNIFWERYEGLLRDSVLEGEAISVEVVEEILGILNTNNTTNDMSRVRNVLQDIKKSIVINIQYENRQKISTIKLNATILKFEYFYYLKLFPNIIIPEYMQESLQIYEDLYLNVYIEDGKKINLNWLFLEGCVEIEINYGFSSKVILMRPLQGIVLLQYMDSDVLTYTQLQTQTNIPSSVMARCLRGLINARILSLDTETFNVESRISLNFDVSRFSLPVHLPDRADFEEDDMNVDKDSVTQAAIVRVAKLHYPKFISYDYILTLVKNKINKYFELEIFKRSLKKLMELEYLQRDERTGTFKYIP